MGTVKSREFIFTGPRGSKRSRTPFFKDFSLQVKVPEISKKNLGKMENGKFRPVRRVERRNLRKLATLGVSMAPVHLKFLAQAAVQLGGPFRASLEHWHFDLLEFPQIPRERFRRKTCVNKPLQLL